MNDFLLRTQGEADNEQGSCRCGADTIDAITSAIMLAYNVMINASAIHGVGEKKYKQFCLSLL